MTADQRPEFPIPEIHWPRSVPTQKDIAKVRWYTRQGISLEGSVARLIEDDVRSMRATFTIWPMLISNPPSPFETLPQTFQDRVHAIVWYRSVGVYFLMAERYGTFSLLPPRFYQVLGEVGKEIWEDAIITHALQEELTFDESAEQLVERPLVAFRVKKFVVSESLNDIAREGGPLAVLDQLFLQTQEMIHSLSKSHNEDPLVQLEGLDKGAQRFRNVYTMAQQRRTRRTKI